MQCNTIRVYDAIHHNKVLIVLYMSKYFLVCDEYQLQNGTRVQLENYELNVICNNIFVFVF